VSGSEFAKHPDMRDHDLHGSAPDKCSTALLLIDIINDLDFPEADMLLRFAMPMAKALKDLKSKCRKCKVPAIYINDNFGRWQSNFAALVDHATKSKGRSVVKQLLPRKDDYFVLKPKHSAFYSTTLDTLLRYLGTKHLIITGMAANICVLFTANDAYMRDYDLWIPRNCVASNTTRENEFALQQMESILKADIRPFERARGHAFLKTRTRKKG
jgi:nicotinamidase-related amidase